MILLKGVHGNQNRVRGRRIADGKEEKNPNYRPTLAHGYQLDGVQEFRIRILSTCTNCDERVP
jgi:hypothetical protein